jgi:Cu(I)/Ag(I) efflux system membrane fusion protein
MSNKLAWLVLVLIALAAAYLAGAYLAGARVAGGPDATGDAPGSGAAGEREVLYWVAPMDPNYRRDKPGKSPMGMDLVPVYADEAPAESGVRIHPGVEQNLGVRSAAAAYRPLWRKIEATGYVGFDETLISRVSLRTEGWIARLAVNAEGERVARGDLLFELYSPELVNAQKEYLQARQRGDARLQRAAGEKLQALGMVGADIDRLSSSGEASERIQVLAPRDGVVFALNVREGMYVEPNTTALSLADLSSVWLQAEVFESQAEWVAAGQAAEARLDYLPGQVFSGQVDYVYPVLDPTTRTLRVRLRFDNQDERLKPNMYAQVSIFGKLQPNALSIPREAVIRAPGRDRVVLALGEGRFAVHEVMTGMESGDWVEILAGIREGDRVVTSAQFLIDSEASLAGSITRLGAAPDSAGRPPAGPVFGSGKVEAVDAQTRRLRLSHGPIEALAWPSMTMEFDVDPDAGLEGIAPGQDIRFALRQEQAGHWVISQVGSPQVLGSVSKDMAEAGVAATEPGAATPATRYGAEGTVKSVDPSRRSLRVSHGPIDALGWRAMTMEFKVDDAVELDAVLPGQSIHFMIRRAGEGLFVIDEIHVMEERSAAPGAHHHD